MDKYATDDVISIGDYYKDYEKCSKNNSLLKPKFTVEI